MIKEDLGCYEIVTISDLAEEQRTLFVELFGEEFFKKGE